MKTTLYLFFRDYLNTLWATLNHTGTGRPSKRLTPENFFGSLLIYKLSTPLLPEMIYNIFRVFYQIPSLWTRAKRTLAVTANKTSSLREATSSLTTVMDLSKTNRV
jgi:hypothetical protein